MFRRGWGTFYCEDLVTKKQESLKTRDKDEAGRLVAAKNETHEGPAFSRQLARVYWKAGDPINALIIFYLVKINSRCAWIHGLRFFRLRQIF
jgi:hypothetical protein